MKLAIVLLAVLALTQGHEIKQAIQSMSGKLLIFKEIFQIIYKN